MSTDRGADDPTMVVILFSDYKKAELLVDRLAGQGMKAFTEVGSWTDYCAVDCSDLGELDYCPVCAGQGGTYSDQQEHTDLTPAEIVLRGTTSTWTFCEACQGTGTMDDYLADREVTP